MGYSSYFSVLIVGGIALFLPVPWFASRILQLDFGTSFLIITALVNLHHFILDGAIWKLRDGRIAALLLNTKKENDRTDSAKVPANWFVGNSFSIRFVKTAAVLGLVLLAVIDQAKFYYSTKNNDSSSLKFASQLNPFDASLKLKLARSSEANGDLADAQTKLEEAVRINPSFRQAQDSLARLLIQSGRYEEALSHYQKMFQYLKPDANALINYGVLAAQLNREDEALKSWQDALKIDNNQPNAHFYLAELMTKQKNFDNAINHYEQFLVVVGNNQNTPAKSDPYLVLRAAQSLSIAHRETGNREKSLAIFNKTLKLAEKTSDPEIMAEILISRAETEADEREALSDFQRALTLTKKDSIYGGKPEHWFKFGKFLNEIKANPRLIFACFTKAEMQTANNQTEEKTSPETLKAEISRLETTLNQEEIKLIKDKTDTFLQEALTLKLQ